MTDAYDTALELAGERCRACVRLLSSRRLRVRGALVGAALSALRGR
jgi:hypothetical protein